MSLKKYSKEWLTDLCASSTSFAEVLAKAGRKPGGGAQATLKKKIAEWGINISHFKGQAWSKGKTLDTDKRVTTRERYNLSDMFVENSPYTRSLIKQYVLRHNLIPYQCAYCGNKGEWNNKPLNLQLDHINGINNDHRLSNLQFLCPNCHSQTETFSGKNKKQEITLEEVELAISDIGPLSANDICLYLSRSLNGSNINKIKLLALKLGYNL